MNNQPAFKELCNTYDIEDMQEIVNHGCISGVCFKHIYYADTISFFDKYEDEIYSELEECFGVDTLVELFTKANAELDQYKNDVVWLYIEHVSSIVVTTMEEEEAAQDEIIGSYIDKEPIKLYANYSPKEVELLQNNGFNPVNSMTMNRYCQV